MANAVRRRRAVVLALMGAIAALHLLRLGSHLKGDLYILYDGYASDILLPSGFYLLLRAGAETLQAFGIPPPGSTFDRFDHAACACGAALGAAADRVIFPRIFRFWAEGEDHPELSGSSHRE